MQVDVLERRDEARAAQVGAQALQSLREADSMARLAASKMRRPRYDEIYFKGVEWLDSL